MDKENNSFVLGPTRKVGFASLVMRRTLMPTVSSSYLLTRFLGLYLYQDRVFRMLI
jgi:hypothetical protein